MNFSFSKHRREFSVAAVYLAILVLLAVNISQPVEEYGAIVLLRL